jgi:ABC-type transport system involved in cytochrome c biogenesis permease component
VGKERFRALLRHLEESVRLLELRRYRRILTSGRLPVVYALGIFATAWMLVPFLFGSEGVLAGNASIVLFRGWPAGILLTTTALAAGLGSFLRAQSLWQQERQLRTYQSWLLTYQHPARAAATTILMSALLGLGLTAIPASFGILFGLFSGLLWWQYVLNLLLLSLCALLGASLGAAVFFINYQLVPRQLFYPGLVLAGLLTLGVWLRIESVENGWRRNWDEHPARVARALSLVTPVPVVFGTSAPAWWGRYAARSLGVTLPVWGAALLYAGFLLLASGYAGWLAVRGYVNLASDPERMEEKPRAPMEELGQEFYWKGFANPVLTRDIRTRLRSKDTAEFIFFASIAVAAGAFVPLLMTTSDLSDPLKTAEAARQVFFWLTMTLVALAALVAPGLTAEVIAQERVQGTLETLVETPLRPREILTGKIMGAVCVLVLLISPSLPLFGLCYLFHGASGGQVAGVYLLLVATLAVSTLIGVTQSAIHPKAGMAKFWAYACTAIFVAFPGGPLWIAALTAAPQADMRQALGAQASIGAMMAIFYIGFLVLFWGNACEQLEYSEY